MMKKPLLVSLAAAALLTGANVQAASMFDRMTEMETEMKALQAELAEVKAAKAAAAVEEEEEVVTSDEADDEDAEEADDEDEEDDEDDDEMSDAEELEEQLTELNKRTSGNHLKFGVDFRTAIDNLQYKMADGSTQKNDALFTNRLWINMNWAATENLSFTGQLAYNKAYGARSGSGQNIAAMEDFDWIAAENPNDGVIRLRSAYFFYRNDTFLGADIPWTFSVGRRPSTNGHLVNLREDDTAASPMGHTINVEFDGASAKFTVWEDIGMYLKFCAGRGGTNASPKFFSIDPTNNNNVTVSAPYATDTDADEIPDIDLGGVIFVPYDDGQYSIGTQYYYANNLIDADLRPSANPLDGYDFHGMKTVGGLHSFTANFVISGIGNEWSDFLDDTLFFASGAISITNPYSGEEMLGGSDARRGYSAWVGLQFPSLLTEEGRWGVEYNYGSAYWRSITYGEDTLAGSKLAARGNAYEVYFTEPLIEDIFSFQLRYTYIDYNYAGSNGFFGSATGTPYKISEMTPQQGSSVTVDTASDLRAYLRYRF